MPCCGNKTTLSRELTPSRYCSPLLSFVKERSRRSVFRGPLPNRFFFTFTILFPHVENRLMKKILLCLIFSAVIVSVAHATHIRAGEITYRCLGGLQYEITVTIYMKDDSPASNLQCDIDLYLGYLNGSGDSVIAIVPRSNGFIGSSCNGPMGELIPGTNVRKNVYTMIATYPGSGDYWISILLRNRDNGIVNIPNRSEERRVGKECRL